MLPGRERGVRDMREAHEAGGEVQQEGGREGTTLGEAYEALLGEWANLRIAEGLVSVAAWAAGMGFPGQRYTAVNIGMNREERRRVQAKSRNRRRQSS